MLEIEDPCTHQRSSKRAYVKEDWAMRVLELTSANVRLHIARQTEEKSYL